MDVDVDMDEVEIPSPDASHSMLETQQPTSSDAVSDAVCNEDIEPKAGGQDSSSSVPASSDTVEVRRSSIN